MEEVGVGRREFGKGMGRVGVGVWVEGKPWGQEEEGGEEMVWE